ncbi:hypothetical protein [Taklimakanibacter lacteus]|uniref:hypothetical protein n=1 Tax=Taklimakanibacter lacteus TaxID=2268456 RepID=UPI000E6606FA
MIISVRRLLAGNVAPFSLCLLFAAMLVFGNARAEGSQEEQCRDALKSFDASGWALEKMPRADRCSDDIRLYVDYLATLKTSESNENARAQAEKLLAAADAGNHSAQLLYTLLFTKIVDSKYVSEIVSNSSYSRYSSYVSAWDVLIKAPDLVKYQVGPALDGGVVEAYLPLHIAEYLEWRQTRWPGDRRGAAARLLAVADFYADREKVRPYLRKLLSANDEEMEDFDGLAFQYVGAQLIREETLYCRDKACVADANIKRLICDIRTPEGDSLLNLGRDACDQLSAPLVRIYRAMVIDLINQIIGTVPL